MRGWLARDRASWTLVEFRRLGSTNDPGTVLTGAVEELFPVGTHRVEEEKTAEKLLPLEPRRVRG